MPWTALLMALDTEMTAAQRRASDQSKTVMALLAAGTDSAEAERELFRELDRLTLLRERQQLIRAMREQGDLHPAAA